MYVSLDHVGIRWTGQPNCHFFYCGGDEQGRKARKLHQVRPIRKSSDCHDAVPPDQIYPYDPDQLRLEVISAQTGALMEVEPLSEL